MRKLQNKIETLEVESTDAEKNFMAEVYAVRAENSKILGEKQELENKVRLEIFCVAYYHLLKAQFFS